MGSAPPVCHLELGAPGLYLSRFERFCDRNAFLSADMEPVKFKRRLGRAPSTISPELSRNRVSSDSLTYDSDVAHAFAKQRARRPKQLRLYVDAELREEVAKMLRLQWSPEQIAATVPRSASLCYNLSMLSTTDYDGTEETS